MRNVCGENIIVAEGINNIDFNRIITMNESSTFLWKELQGSDFTVDDMVRLLTDEYEVDADTTRRDAEALCQKWIEAGIAEE